MTDGKIFERDFKESCKRQNIWCMRINDTYYKAKEYDKDCFVPQQCCDYVLHYNGMLIMTELKTTKNKYITIEREHLRMIKKHQYDQMYHNEGDYEFGVLILQLDRDDDCMTYGMRITDFMDFLDKTNKCSINALDIVQNGGEIIEWAVGKTRNHYNIKGLLDKLMK